VLASRCWPVGVGQSLFVALGRHVEAPMVRFTLTEARAVTAQLTVGLDKTTNG
jgi:hypothetical protein